MAFVYPYIMLFISALIGGVFLIIRGIYQFKNWRNGEKDQLWNFLSLWIGGAGLIIAVIGSSQVAIVGEFNLTGYLMFSALFPIAIYCMVIAIGLTTYHLFLKWRKLGK
ncbi:MAG: hypothetical protein ACTSQ8_00600 [Candidatus Helarchaeota archaeon]